MVDEKIALLVHREKCIGCGNCVMACPINVDGKVSAPVLRVEGGIVRVVNALLCGRFSDDVTLRDCRACADICPMGAIELQEFEGWKIGCSE